MLNQVVSKTLTRPVSAIVLWEDSPPSRSSCAAHVVDGAGRLRRPHPGRAPESGPESGAVRGPGGCRTKGRRLSVGNTEALSLAGVLATDRHTLPHRRRRVARSMSLRRPCAIAARSFLWHLSIRWADAGMCGDAGRDSRTQWSRMWVKISEARSPAPNRATPLSGAATRSRTGMRHPLRLMVGTATAVKLSTMTHPDRTR